jgi:hypothetical protein
MPKSDLDKFADWLAELARESGYFDHSDLDFEVDPEQWDRYQNALEYWKKKTEDYGGVWRLRAERRVTRWGVFTIRFPNGVTFKDKEAFCNMLQYVDSIGVQTARKTYEVEFEIGFANMYRLKK